MAADDVVGTQNVSNKVIIENVGAKRIAGSDLIAKAKIPNWMFYIVDIDSMAVYANQGTDVWIGAFGQAVAGDATLRLGLTPFEGQKFYEVTTSTAFTYSGGAWNGGAIKANLLSPTFLTLDAATTLTRGRGHVLAADGNFVLPSSTNPLEDTLGGHAMEFYVARGFTAAHLIRAGAETFKDNVSDNSEDLLLIAGALYSAVFKDGKWEIYYTDVANLQSQLDGKLAKASNLSDVASAATSRSNLGVLSTAQVEAKVDEVGTGVGVVKSGTSAGADIEFAADFATDEEAADPSNAVKVLAPKNIAESVSAATRSSEFNNNTGLLPKSTETKFEFTQNVDPTKVDYPEFSVVFNAEPFVRDTALVSLTVPAGTITLPVNAVVTTHRVILTQSTGLVTLQLSLPPLDVVDLIVLGSILELNGEVFNSILIANPWLASTDYNIRITPLNIVSGGIVSASATVGKVDMTSILLGRESINWEISTSSPHQKTITPTNPISWFYADQAGVILGPFTDEIDGEFLDDGTTSVGVNNFSIQVAFIGSEGDIAVLQGQLIYSNLTAALAAVDNYTPVIPAVLTTALEFSRWVIKGNQFPGGGSLDLTDLNNFQVSQGADVSGGVSQVSAGDVSSSNTNNTLVTTNLQTQVDELDSKAETNATELINQVQWEFKTGGGLLEVNHKYIIGDSLAYTMPPMGNAREFVGLSANGGVTPTMTVDNVTTAEHFIKAIDLVDNGDTTFQIDAGDNGKDYLAISNATDWEM